MLWGIPAPWVEGQPLRPEEGRQSHTAWGAEPGWCHWGGVTLPGMGSVTHGTGPALAQTALALLHALQLLLVPVSAPSHHLQTLQQHLLLLLQLRHLLQLPRGGAHVPVSARTRDALHLNPPRQGHSLVPPRGVQPSTQASPGNRATVRSSAPPPGWAHLEAGSQGPRPGQGQLWRGAKPIATAHPGPISLRASCPDPGPFHASGGSSRGGEVLGTEPLPVTGHTWDPGLAAPPRQWMVQETNPRQDGESQCPRAPLTSSQSTPFVMVCLRRSPRARGARRGSPTPSSQALQVTAPAAEVSA